MRLLCLPLRTARCGLRLGFALGLGAGLASGALAAGFLGLARTARWPPGRATE
ncbi:MAG: hypothetical protein N3D18_04850 [Roseococcus sp.]|nr:hypothetical protein [Roseococcus sp.]